MRAAFDTALLRELASPLAPSWAGRIRLHLEAGAGERELTSEYFAAVLLACDAAKVETAAPQKPEQVAPTRERFAAATALAGSVAAAPAPAAACVAAFGARIAAAVDAAAVAATSAETLDLEFVFVQLAAFARSAATTILCG